MSKKKATAKANFEKTSRKDALVVGAKLSQALWPLCKIVTLVGSIRQGKEMIGDIDIVVIPSIEPAEFLERCKDIVEYEYGGKKKIFGMFMDRPINILVLIGSIFFVVLFLVIAMFDTGQNVDLKYSGDSSKVKEVLESQSFPVVQ